MKFKSRIVFVAITSTLLLTILIVGILKPSSDFPHSVYSDKGIIWGEIEDIGAWIFNHKPDEVLMTVPKLNEYKDINMDVSFLSTLYQLESRDILSCEQIEKYELTIYFPKFVRCHVYQDSYSGMLAQLFIPGRLAKTAGEEDVSLRVSIFEKSMIKNEWLLVGDTAGFYNRKFENINGYIAQEYTTLGAEGSLFRALDVRLDDNHILSFKVQIKEYFGNEKIEFEVSTLNQVLYIIVNSFEYRK